MIYVHAYKFVCVHILFMYILGEGIMYVCLHVCMSALMDVCMYVCMYVCQMKHAIVTYDCMNLFFMYLSLLLWIYIVFIQLVRFYLNVRLYSF